MRKSPSLLHRGYLRLPCHPGRLQSRCMACGGEMEMSTPSSSALRGACMPADDSRASWPPPDAPREAVSPLEWAASGLGRNA